MKNALIAAASVEAGKNYDRVIGLFILRGNVRTIPRV